MVGQFANEPDGIGEPIAIALAHIHFAGERIDGREQAVLDEDVVTRQRFQEARLAGVGVSDERGRRHIAPSLPRIGAMFGDVLEPFLERRDLAANDAAVGFELCFARPPEPDAAADTRQVGPHARQTRQQILELRQLHLQLRLVTARPRGEDVENHLGAVHHAHAETLLQFDALDGGETLIEEHQGCIGILQIFGERLDLALPEIEVGSRRVDALDGLTNHLGSGRIGETLQFLQVLIDMHRFVRTFTRRPNKKGTLDRGLDFYKLTNRSSPSVTTHQSQAIREVARRQVATWLEASRCKLVTTYTWRLALGVMSLSWSFIMGSVF